MSPRKSVSSGYESRCNSSSESSSCTECENEISKKPITVKQREKRPTKSVKNDKKKKSAEYEKPGEGNYGLKTFNQDFVENLLSINSSTKKKSNKYKNGSPSGSSNLSPIPEGKVDCSIPPPIWPRCEENCSHGDVKSLANHVPCRSLFHDGTTNPVNFMYKYNEKYPRCSNGPSRTLWEYFDKCGYFSNSVKTEYEHNWKEYTRNQCNNQNCMSDHDYLPNSGKSRADSGKGSTAESTMERQSDKTAFTQEVLRDLANLIAFAMSRKNSLSLNEIMKTLSDSIQKSLEVLSQTESDDSLKKLCKSLSHTQNLNQVSKALSISSSIEEIEPPSVIEDGKNSHKNGICTIELAAQLQKLQDEANLKKRSDDYNIYEIRPVKDDIYSSESEGKGSTSSSSGCKDIYISSNSSSAGKDGVYSSSSFGSIHERQKIFHREKSGEIYNTLNSVRGGIDSQIKSQEMINKESNSLPRRNQKSRTIEKCPSSDSDVSLIHHQRECSSSSVESTFGYSDSPPTPSFDLSSGQVSGVLNPVFVHDDIYSVPKSVRNTIICETLSRTNDPIKNTASRNCGSSAFAKLISAKRKISIESRTEEIGPLNLQEEGKIEVSTTATSIKVDNTILKKVEHPYYVSFFFSFLFPVVIYVFSILLDQHNIRFLV